MVSISFILSSFNHEDRSIRSMKIDARLPNGMLKVCKSCGLTDDRPAWNGYECRACQIKRVNAYTKNKTASGICRECKLPSIDGKVFCEKHLAAHSKRMRDARARDPDSARKRNKAWRDANPDKCREMFLAYKATNSESFRRTRAVATARRRAKMRMAPGAGLTRSQWNMVIESQASICHDCKYPAKLTIGHLIPISRGGPHDIGNIIGQCFPCNIKQGVKIHPLVALP